MKHLLSILAVFTILISLHSQNSNKSIDPILKEYVDDFFITLQENEIYFNKKQPVLIKFVEGLDNTKILGIARGMYNDDAIYIWITPRFLELSEADRYWVMYHELCHDLFNLEHGSIELMRPYAKPYTSMYDFEDAKEEMILYLKELTDG